MKRPLIYTILLTTLLISCRNDTGFTNPKEAENIDIMGVKTGKWLDRLDSNFEITKDTNAPFYNLVFYRAGKANGMIRTYYRDGKLRCEYAAWGYRPDDTVKVYYESGKIKSLIPYVHDTITGTTRDFYKNGKLELEIPRKNGLYDGVTRKYYPNGQLEKETPCTDDNIDGPEKAYYENGKLQYVAPYVDGKLNGNYTEYYENGKVKAISPYVNGKLNGIKKEYADDGALSYEGNYEFGNRTGLVKWYYAHGKLSEDAMYKNDSVQGIVHWYDTNGKVQYTATYKNDEIIDGKFKSDPDDDGDYSIGTYKNGALNGTMYWYYADGKVETEVTYVDGLAQGIKKGFYENGKPKFTQAMKDDDVNGIAIFYKPDGSVDYKCVYDLGIPVSGIERSNFEKGGEGAYTEATYDNSKLNGSFKWFYPDGKLECQCIYVNDSVLSGTARKDYDEADGGGYTEACYVNGKLNGVYKWFYSEGKLAAQIPYTNNVEDGLATFYYKSGIKKEEIQWRDGRRMADATYDEHGKLMK